MSLYAVSEATTHTYETLLCEGSTAVPKLMSGIPPEVFNLAAVVPQNIDSSSRFFRTFRKGKPKALGIVLIVAAVLQVALGIALIYVKYEILLDSGVPFWGSIFYIIAGALTIAAQSKPSMCLVRGSLSLNIISTIVSVVALILISIETALFYIFDIRNIKGYSVTFLILMINLLLFCVTLSVSIFGCRSLSHIPSNVTQVFVMQNDTAVSKNPPRVRATYPLPPSPSASIQYVNDMY